MNKCIIAIATANCLVGSLVGCGSDGPETVRIYGTITADGSVCPGGGTIYFQPIKSARADLPQRPATADFEADGKFRVTSFDDGDGLVPGDYQVRVECWLSRAQGYDKPGIPWGPGAYTLPTPLVVEPGQGSVGVDIDIPATAAN